jgi:hypothetical protein
VAQLPVGLDRERRAAPPCLPLPARHLEVEQDRDRLFSFIAQNWRDKPLVSHQVIINLIGATTTRTGLEVCAQLDERDYPKQIKFTDAELAAVNLSRDQFHPEWNYTIKLRGPT